MDSYLRDLGINTGSNDKTIHLDKPNSFLIEESLKSSRGKLSKDGALVVLTGKFTGRAAKDKYVVKSSSTQNTIWWENNVNEMSPTTFAKLREHVCQYLDKQSNLYVTEKGVGAHTTHHLLLRLVTPSPSHALFASHMFRTPTRSYDLKQDYTVLHAPELNINPAQFNTKSGTAIVTCFDTRTVIIVGTLYAGEIKKSLFAIMNYILPERGILPMHSGANIGQEGSAVFFGLSGTGKTTLSTDQGRALIGDDEHGLSDQGVFNFEGGCYAKTFKLDEKAEPAIFRASNRFGALLENVKMNPVTREVDFNDSSISENGRASYPLSFIDGVEPTHNGPVPKNMFFLSADAFGVLPPVAKLTPEQAMFYFVLGYTAKLAGTEVGVTGPSATYSPCFGAPFMMRHPTVYAKLLEQYMNKHKISVWFINTGWANGPYGVGKRFPIHVTRSIIRQVQSGSLAKGEMHIDPIFGLHLPKVVEGVDAKTLNPALSWPDKNAYDKKARELAHSFHTQMKKFGDFYSQNIKGAPLAQ